MLAGLIVITEFVFLVELLRRVQFLCAAQLVIAYCIFAQLIFYNARALGYDGVAGPESLLSYQTHATFGVLIYFIISITAYVSTLLINIEHTNTRYEIESIIFNNDRLVKYSIYFVVAYTLLHFMLIDYDDLWHHRDYSTTGLRFDGGLFDVFGRLRPLVAMAVIILMQLSYFAGKSMRFYVLLIVSIWHFLIPFTGSSRYAVVLVFASGGSAMMFARRRRLLIAIAHAVFGFLVLQAMIAGRGGSEFGLAAIPSLVASMFSFDSHSATLGFFNLFQGITVTIDGLIIAPQYDWLYGILSISPFPSSIDGFDEVLSRSEFRLSVFVPMSSIAEAYLFGWSIFSVVVLVFFFALRSTLLVARAGYHLWSLLSSIFLAAMFVMANAYPLRNTFRQFLLILIVNTILVVVARVRTGRGRTSPAGRHPMQRGGRVAG